MHYIVVQPQGDLSSEERAYGISRELYNITAPAHIQDDYQTECMVFPIIEHPTSGLLAMRVELDFQIYVHSQATLDRLIALFPIMDVNEISALTNYITSQNKIVFSQIIPSDVSVRDTEWMADNGWFNAYSDGEG